MYKKTKVLAAVVALGNATASQIAAFMEKNVDYVSGHLGHLTNEGHVCMTTGRPSHFTYSPKLTPAQISLKDFTMNSSMCRKSHDTYLLYVINPGKRHECWQMRSKEIEQIDNRLYKFLNDYYTDSLTSDFNQKFRIMGDLLYDKGIAKIVGSTEGRDWYISEPNPERAGDNGFLLKSRGFFIKQTRLGPVPYLNMQYQEVKVTEDWFACVFPNEHSRFLVGEALGLVGTTLRQYVRTGCVEGTTATSSGFTLPNDMCL